METLTVILLVVVAALLVLFLLRQSGAKVSDPIQSNILFQQQMEALRSELTQGLRSQEERISQSLSLVTNQTGQVGTRLDTAAKVIQDVQNKLGELGKATQEIKELGQSVSTLEEMLKAPKFRGGLGELLLEDLLKQVLPNGSFETQYRFKKGHTVDAVIHTAGNHIVPIDSKFPLENFEKMVKATSDQERRTATLTFRKDVKKHIDSIAEKYILPDEGTFDFSLMYIPAENIYYETIIKDEKLAEEDGLYAYAVQKHVVPVSPNSFYAYLSVIALGFKGLQIEERAKEISQNLARLNSELLKFAEVFETLGNHIKNTSNKYDEADKKLASFTDKLKGIQAPEAPEPKQLDVFGN
ncbi:MAG: DNA recombination protein RmuC [Ignavibacteriales bacterium]|nr:DNA recombination protein RmuC [Ignavibacteriales bacterium]